MFLVLLGPVSSVLQRAIATETVSASSPRHLDSDPIEYVMGDVRDLRKNKKTPKSSKSPTECPTDIVSNDSQWLQIGDDFTIDDGGNIISFQHSVSTSSDGNTVAVSTYDYSEYGTVRVFEWDETSSSWKK